jgi:hypothetical protein
MMKLCARALACAIVMAAAIAPAEATSLRPRNIVELIGDSQMILAGRVESVTDGIDANGTPYTEVTIAVSEAVKGKAYGGSTYTFRQFGLLKPRKMPNGKTFIAMSPEGFPRWAAGETVVAFMTKPATRTGLQTTAGLAQGKLNMLNGRVMNEFSNRGMFDGVQIDAALLSDKEREMLKSQGAVDAATFVGLVGRAVNGNWIARGKMR